MVPVLFFFFLYGIALHFLFVPGSMHDIDAIDVPRQNECKMPMRQWVEYYNSPNREKVLNVISLEFSGTK